MNKVDEAAQTPTTHDGNEHREYVITVTYNGVDKHVHYHLSDKIAVILQRAISAFGITQNVHVLALFTADGTELNDSQTAQQTGLPHQRVLLLRPSTVKGGSL